MDNRIEVRPGRLLNIKLYSNPASDTTVFLVHGLGGRSEQWHEQINFLKDKYTLVVPDLLGHGNSDKPIPKTNNPYCFSEHDLDLHSIFNRYSSGKNIVIGHSYGGALATSLTFDHQDNVHQLILMAPTACTSSLKIPMVYHLPATALEWIRPYLEKQFVQLAFDRSTSPDVIHKELQADKLNPMYVIKSMITGASDTPQLDITMLAIPTLILLGESDKLVPHAISRGFYQSLPHHHFETIAHASHLLMIEKPREVNQKLSLSL